MARFTTGQPSVHDLVPQLTSRWSRPGRDILRRNPNVGPWHRRSAPGAAFPAGGRRRSPVSALVVPRGRRVPISYRGRRGGGRSGFPRALPGSGHRRRHPRRPSSWARYQDPTKASAGWWRSPSVSASPRREQAQAFLPVARRAAADFLLGVLRRTQLQRLSNQPGYARCSYLRGRECDRQGCLRGDPANPISCCC